MNSNSRRYAIAAAVIVGAIAPSMARPSPQSQETQEQLQRLSREIQRLVQQGASPSVIDALKVDYEKLAALVGESSDSNPVQHAGSSSLSTSQMASAPACGGALTTTNFVGGGAGSAISGGTTPLITTETVNVSGLGSYIWDVNFNLNLPHTFASDLDITLQSPAGTLVTITTDNGGANDNVYAGTLFDDSTLPATSTVTDFVYTNLVVATPLAPEGRLTNFRGEDPNGVWTLRVVDDAGGDVGNLNAWSIDVTTLAAAPTETTTSVSKLPGLAITDLATVVDTQTVTTTDTYLSNLSLYLEVLHTECQDLDITLTSPAGTVVTVTTDNGAANDNVFNGTLFSNDALLTVTDAVYTNLVPAPLLSPEGGFEAFVGQDPNGIWTLSVTDDLATDVGTLVRWDLNVTTAAAAPSPSAPANFGQATGILITNGTVNLPPLVVTASVSGVGTSLWDLDLFTDLSHTSAGDFDITLTSPAGTTVVVTTDNGGTNDNTFAGTLWDENTTDTCTDHVYANLTLATPLSPEGRFSAFRGEDPNGTWTLSIGDDATADNGTLNSWSLAVTTIPSAPTTVTTTFSQSPALPVPTGAPTTTAGTTIDTLAVSGIGTSIANVILDTNITHTFAGDLDITLTSPAGTVVVVTTDNGGGNDNVFAGTTWSGDSTNVATDFVFVNLTVAPLLSPEGSFDNFIGQDPNGTWTLTIVDDASGDFGALNSWGLTIATCGSAPVVYCTSGTTTNGCIPSISATGNPNVAHSNSCVIDCLNVEAQKTGLFFYGLTQSGVPWCSGGTSFLCVKAPTQRTSVGNTGGSPGGACDGTFQLDWNAWQLGHPGALGNPWTAGNKAYVQLWFRDPPVCKTTALSDAVELTYQP
ncbi:MAG: proprotein convertase P-domain-containing protein [Planctomycetes bacterium]|nr:proprotein convertase P-domain-containing protein [Planctomycetota bacterium]